MGELLHWSTYKMYAAILSTSPFQQPNGQRAGNCQENIISGKKRTENHKMALKVKKTVNANPPDNQT